MVTKAVILKAARARIEDERDEYICHAIYDSDTGNGKQRRALTKWIDQMLGRHVSYNGWLRDEHPDFWRRHKNADWGFRDARLAWIDWMILQVGEST